MRYSITMTVNGAAISAQVEARTLLVDFLRDRLHLTGTHIGCDTSQCGACVVRVGVSTVKACTMLAVQADGEDVLTIEGMAQDGRLHPMQEAFRAHHALQCGFCTPGMVMTAVELAEGADLDEAAVRHLLDGNLCRCTGYHNIVRAILAGARAMRQ